MLEERRMILEMLKDGKVSVDEAERLLKAMEAEGSDETSVGFRNPGANPKRIRVRVTENGKPKVNVKVPFSLVKVALKMGKSIGGMSMQYSKSEDVAFAMEMLQNIDIDEVLDSLNDGDITLPYTMVDVDDDKGESVLVILE